MSETAKRFEEGKQKGQPPESKITPISDKVLNFQFLPTKQALNVPDVEWVVDGIFFRGGVTNIYGDSGIGKSYLAMNWAASIGFADMRALYVATEGVYTYKTRMAAWLKHHKQMTDTMLWYTQPVDLFDADTVAAFISAARWSKLDLIVFDIFSDCIGEASENDSSNMKKVIRHLKLIAAECNCAVAFVHHATKAGDSYRGSSVLRNNVDMVIEVRESGDGVMIVNDKNKAQQKWEAKRIEFVTIELPDGKSDRVALPAEKVYHERNGMDASEFTILKELHEHNDGLTRKQIQNITKLSESTVKNRFLPELISRGWIAFDGRGRPYRITPEGIEKLHDEIKARSKAFS